MKLNLGSADVRIAGFSNVDISHTCHPDILSGVEKLPLEDNSVEEILASHIYEHLPCTSEAIREWHRVLMPGGTITVLVPDFLKGYQCFLSGEFTLEYFNATIFGANQLGYRKEYAHQQALTAKMLVQRMSAFFPNAKEVDEIMLGGVRQTNSGGQAFVIGTKNPDHEPEIEGW
jgi:predicted SAM-dependent methyltransferase